jgi:glucosamine--fructose-6-phosphate aminotransferase (isomerizing)
MSFMAQEAREAPEAVARFLDCNSKALTELGSRLRKLSPHIVLTSARGSSDNATGYFKYLTEILLGVPCASMGASVVSIYGSKLKVKGALCLTISQSGQSPDIVALQKAARKAGALSIALVNAEDSPIAHNADIYLPLCAGPEQSVAATKTFIVSLVAGAAIAAHWHDDKNLIATVANLPEKLSRACEIDWPELTKLALHAESFYVLGRGPSLPIAAETALKLKETCAIHAEAYSFAEVMHGPLELLGAGFPILAYSPNDQSRSFFQAAIAKLRNTGARILVAEQNGLSYAQTDHPLLDPISMIQTAYLAVEKLAQARGRNPDHPRLLKKITETI